MATKVQGPSVARTFTDSIFWEVSLATNKKIATDLIDYYEETYQRW